MMVDGKTPIARCADKDKYATLAGIDQAATRVIVNPGGTNEKFARDAFKRAPIAVVWRQRHHLRRRSPPTRPT